MALTVFDFFWSNIRPGRTSVSLSQSAILAIETSRRSRIQFTDASAIAEMFKAVQFDAADCRTDLSISEMCRAMRDFATASF
jgi:hypothetical protein